MKKKILLVLTFILSFLIFTDKAFAAIDTSTMEIECIYANGVSIGLSYDEAIGKLSTYIKEYPISKSVIINAPDMSDMYLFDGEGSYPNENIKKLSSLTCPSEVRVWKVVMQQKDEEGDWQKSTRAIYSFDYYYNDDTSATITSYYGGTGGQDNGTGWWIFGTAATKKTQVIDLKSNSPLEQASGTPEVRVPLVAERLYVVGNLDESDYSFSYSSFSKEAVGSNTYIQFLKGRGAVYAKRGKTITSVSDTSIIGDKYICVKESIAEQDSSRSDSSYKFNLIRHSLKKAGISKDKDKNEYPTCEAGYVPYERSEKVCEINGSKNGESFCDKFSNTAKVLIKIIQIMQFVVPGLVIVLTSVDIARIVIAGEVEEKLPKMKKNIIIRLIIMCLFLFLPLITKLIIASINDKKIYEVDCLFNGGISYSSDNNEDCKTVINKTPTKPTKPPTNAELK